MAPEVIFSDMERPGVTAEYSLNTNAYQLLLESGIEEKPYEAQEFIKLVETAQTKKADTPENDKNAKTELMFLIGATKQSGGKVTVRNLNLRKSLEELTRQA